jgi:hypothetical protein
MSKPAEAEREESRRRLERFRDEVPDGSTMASLVDHLLWADDLDEEMWPR